MFHFVFFTLYAGVNPGLRCFFIAEIDSAVMGAVQIGDFSVTEIKAQTLVQVIQLVQSRRALK
ncbi:TPA: hypothetical protein JD342_23810 [Citrobacter freundii]|nr:hypothetical protein [Citrobacter freundii]